MNHTNALSDAALKYIALEDQFGAHNYHPIPVVIEKGEGVFLYDVDGKKYLLSELTFFIYFLTKNYHIYKRTILSLRLFIILKKNELSYLLFSV